MLYSCNRIYYTRTTNIGTHFLAERDKLLAKKLCVLILLRLNFGFLWSKSHNTTRQNCIDTIWFLPNMTFYEGLIRNSSSFTANLICLQTSWKQFQNRNVRFLGWATCLLGPGAARWGLFKIFLRKKIFICQPASVDVYLMWGWNLWWSSWHAEKSFWALPNESLAELAALLVVVAQCLLHLEGTACLSCPPACRALPCRYSMNAVVHSTAVCAAIAELL